jgi:autotransporter-associated beta strand protein
LLSCPFANAQHTKNEERERLQGKKHKAIFDKDFHLNLDLASAHRDLTLASQATSSEELQLSAQPDAVTATSTWNSTGASQDWSNAGNWTGGTPGSADIGLFNGTANPSDGKVGFSGDTSLGAISLSGTSSSITFGSISSGGSRSITINGATVNSVANTILADTTTSATTLTIVPTINGNKNLTLTLGNTTNVIQASSGNTIDLQVGLGESNSGSTLTVQGGGLVVLDATNSYTGLTTITSGTLREGVSNAISTGGISVNGSTAVFDLGAGHSDTVGTVTVDGGGSITGTGTSTLTSTGTFEMKSGSVSAILAGSGIALNKTTSGTVTLSGANAYTGATTVSGGKLLVNGSLASGSAVTVSNSGTILGGTGTISGTVGIGSGAAILGGTGTTASGILTVANNLTLNSGSIIELALGASGAHSTLARTGGAWSFQTAQQFAFIDLGATTGTYSNIITGLASNPGTSSWTILNAGMTGTFTYSGGNINLTLTAVPEPRTWIGGALAVVAIGCTQRKRFARLLKVARR